MKAVMLTGGLFGFVLGISPALLQGVGWGSALWRASLIAYVAGWLARWWWGIWTHSWREVLLQRQAQAAQAKHETAARK
jgi:hypothetical protein